MSDCNQLEIFLRHIVCHRGKVKLIQKLFVLDR